MSGYNHHNRHFGVNPSMGNPLQRDYNGDGLITEADYAIGAQLMGWGPRGERTAREAFRHHDRDRNGFLDRYEIMSSNGGGGGGGRFNSNYGNPLVRDYNGDGLITEADYAIGARQMGWGAFGEQIARDAFRYHDKDRSGFLDRHEAEMAHRGY